ncbi:hypothetical protein KFE25_006868 [Diacronema lutheri]|uniref:Mitochondrial cardiolipin hydrolase n=2 Tax=Diacronema lutheri TaxID=2081491 RepID=A0A8J5XFE0_DIALT|nr:hypothetical protein KFE25_006868 [Diacronema lutheri]
MTAPAVEWLTALVAAILGGAIVALALRLSSRVDAAYSEPEAASAAAAPAKPGAPACSRELAAPSAPRAGASGSDAKLPIAAEQQRWPSFIERTLDEPELNAELRSTIDACVRGLPGSVEMDWLLRCVLSAAMEKSHRIGSKRARLVCAIADAIQAAVIRTRTSPAPRARAALFFPSNVSFRYVLNLLGNATVSLDICVYTITDRQLVERILAAHARRVRVRIVTDDKKAFDQGSAVFSLAQAGIPTVVAEQEAGWEPPAPGSSANGGGSADGGGARERHMHHKFAVVDGSVLLTGSFNWTHAAHERNCENLLVTDDAYFVARYAAEFERTWNDCRRDNRLGTNAAAQRIQALYRGQSFRRSFSKESFSRLVLGEGSSLASAAPRAPAGGQANVQAAQAHDGCETRAIDELREGSARADERPMPRELANLYQRAQRQSNGFMAADAEPANTSTRSPARRPNGGTGIDTPGAWKTPPLSPSRRGARESDGVPTSARRRASGSSRRVGRQSTSI